MSERVLFFGCLRSTHSINLLNYIDKSKYLIDKIDINNGVFEINKIHYSFNIIKRIATNSKINWPFIFILRLISLFYIFSKISFVKYDKIVIHYLKYEYYIFIPFLKLLSNNLIAILHGGDTIRNPIKIIMNLLLKNFNTITLSTPKVFEYFNNYFSENVKNKSRMLYLPNIAFENILKSKSKVENVPNTKGNILVGTTGHPIENHEVVIDFFINNKRYLEYFNLYFHLGLQVSEVEKLYATEIEEKIKYNFNANDYKIIMEFLSFEDLIKLRSTTNILINVRKNDQFSAGMLEALACGSYVINGSWLSYEYLTKKLGVYFFPIENIDQISEALNLYLEKMESINNKTLMNMEIIRNEFDIEKNNNEWLKILG